MVYSPQPPPPFTAAQVTSVINYKEFPSICSIDDASSPTFSLIYVIDRINRKLLLGKKKRGFAVGIINGYGGKLDPGETMDECARRELHEESGLLVEPQDLKRKGRLVFTLPNHEKPHHIVVDIALYVYLADSASTEAAETDEMSPRWYDIDHDLPKDNMWPDFHLYWPVLHDLVFGNDQDQHILARIDYETVKSPHESPIPSLQSLGVAEHPQTAVEGEETVDAVVGYWLALAPGS